MSFKEWRRYRREYRALRRRVRYEARKMRTEAAMRSTLAYKHDFQKGQEAGREYRQVLLRNHAQQQKRIRELTP